MADPSLKANTDGLRVTTVISCSSSALAVGVGDFIIAAVTVFANVAANPVSAVTDTVGNIYTRAGSAISYIGGQSMWDVWYTANPASTATSSNVVSFKFAGTTAMNTVTMWQTVWSWGGAATIAYNAATTVTSVSGSTIASLSVSTSFVDSLVVGSFDWITNSATYANGTGTIIGTPAGSDRVYFVYRNTDAAGGWSVTLSGGPTGTTGPLYAAIAKSFHINAASGGAAAVNPPTLPITGVGR